MTRIRMQLIYINDGESSESGLDTIQSSSLFLYLSGNALTLQNEVVCYSSGPFGLLLFGCGSPNTRDSNSRGSVFSERKSRLWNHRRQLHLGY